MTQDNSYSFAQFAAIGGLDHEGESFSSSRIFTDYESTVDYARELVHNCFDCAYVSDIYPDGTMELKEVTRVADEEPSVVSL